MNKNSVSKLIICSLCVLFLVRVISLSGAGSKLEYSQFTTEMQQGRISEVKLGANPQFLPASLIGTKAFIKTTTNMRKTVNISSNEEQSTKLIVDNVKGDIQIPTANNWHIWYEELSAICFPLLLFTYGTLELLEITTNWKFLTNVKPYVVIAFLLILPIMLAHQYWDTIKVRNPLPYVQFLQEVQNGKVEKIGLSPDRSRGVVDTKDGNRDIVNLPPDDRLDGILTQNIKGKIYTIPDDQFNDIVTKNNAKVKGYRNHSP